MKQEDETTPSTAASQQEETKEPESPLQQDENPFGYSTLDDALFKQKVLTKFNLTQVIERNQKKFQSEHLDSLVKLVGSRTFMWKIFLGLISSSPRQEDWVNSLQAHRNLYYKKLGAVLSFKEEFIQKALDVEPLMEAKMQAADGAQADYDLDPELQAIQQDKDLRELIKQDIDRTCQEIEFFERESVKENLSNILYMWSKDNNEIGYRQGMNEILAILTMAIFSEVRPEVEERGPDQMIGFLFSRRHAYADVYWCFDRIMNLGIKHLYAVTKDMSQVKKEMKQKGELDPPANSQKTETKSSKSKKQELRTKLEKAYDEEKSKSTITKRCLRIYDEFLCQQDYDLYEHLTEVQLTPELQLMRWLRCVLSREFEPPLTLLLWDFILGGVYLHYTRHNQERLLQQITVKNSADFPPKEQEPFINLDIICVSLITSIRETLLESDFSMCLASLLHYEEPQDHGLVVVNAIKIKRDMFRDSTFDYYKQEGGQELDDFFDFEAIEQDQDMRLNTNRRNVVVTKGHTSLENISEDELKAADLKSHTGKGAQPKKEQPPPKKKRGLFPSVLPTFQKKQSTTEDEKKKSGGGLLPFTSKAKNSGGEPGGKKQKDRQKREELINLFVDPEDTDFSTTNQIKTLKDQNKQLSGNLDRLEEASSKQKFQMRNASKNLMKVDEYLGNLQSKSKGKMSTGEYNKLNATITDLRDAMNMLSTQP